MDKALVFIFTKERCFQNFIFSSKTQGNANYNVQILNYFLKSQGKTHFLAIPLSHIAKIRSKGQACCVVYSATEHKV